MKKRFFIIVAVLFAFSLLFGSFASFAEPLTVVPPISTPKPTKTPKATTKPNKAAERIAFLKEIQPIIDEIASNRKQIKALQDDLDTARQLALAHIDALKADIANVSAERLTKISDFVAQVNQIRIDFGDSNPKMLKEKQILRGNLKSKNYVAIKAAMQNVIRVQNGRIDNLKKLIDLFNIISVV